jgi:hypothetical protein
MPQLDSSLVSATTPSFRVTLLCLLYYESPNSSHRAKMIANTFSLYC